MQYYRTTFPAEALWQWLSRPINLTADSVEFECYFRLGDSTKDGYVLRPIYFASGSMLRTSLMNAGPVHAHIGAICYETTDVVEVRKSPMAQALIHDIDFDQYICRICCGDNKRVCSACWESHVKPVVVKLRAIIDRHFGLANSLWIFSGKKGIHVWVKTAETLAMSSAERKMWIDKWR